MHDLDFQESPVRAGMEALIKTIPDQRIQDVMIELVKVVDEVREDMENLREDIEREKEVTQLYEKKTTASKLFPVGGGSVVG